MRETDERITCPNGNMDMIIHVSDEASLCLALSAACLNAFQEIPIDEREDLYRIIGTAEISVAAIRYAADLRSKEGDATSEMLSAVGAIRLLCAEMLEICAVIWETEFSNSQNVFCADLCLALASHCRTPMPVV